MISNYRTGQARGTSRGSSIGVGAGTRVVIGNRGRGKNQGL